MENQEQPTLEGRILAGVAHASIVVQGLGILVGVVLYVTQREKSRWVAFQALQAAVYQLLAMIAVVVLWFVWGIFYAISFIPIMNLPENAAPPPIFWVGISSMVIPMLIMVIIGLIGLWAGLRAFQGHDFRYPLIGGWLERYMQG